MFFMRSRLLVVCYRSLNYLDDFHEKSALFREEIQKIRSFYELSTVFFFFVEKNSGRLKGRQFFSTQTN